MRFAKILLLRTSNKTDSTNFRSFKNSSQMKTKNACSTENRQRVLAYQI